MQNPSVNPEGAGLICCRGQALSRGLRRLGSRWTEGLFWAWAGRIVEDRAWVEDNEQAGNTQTGERVGNRDMQRETQRGGNLEEEDKHGI